MVVKVKKSVVFFLFPVILLSGCLSGNDKSDAAKKTHTIFVFGGDINRQFVRYVAELTGKPEPKMCYVPTASADNKDNIAYWNSICKSLPVEPHVLEVWVSSMCDTISFEETLLNMDAIVVGGGNTLNMMGIWNAQEIDKIMKEALDKGIILAGGSAGSICWFDEGISDSRPGRLSVVEGLGFLPYSNCPHYSDENRKELYHRLMAEGKIGTGYASDDFSGILFKDGKFVEAVSRNEFNDSYYVYSEDENIRSEKLATRYLIAKDAIDEDEYETVVINKNMAEYAGLNTGDPVMDEFKAHVARYYAAPDKFADVAIGKMFIYKDSLAAVVSKLDKYDFYLISLFYKNNEKWTSIGDDIADTVVESEISFRERADMHLARMAK